MGRAQRHAQRRRSVQRVRRSCDSRAKRWRWRAWLWFRFNPFLTGSRYCGIKRGRGHLECPSGCHRMSICRARCGPCVSYHAHPVASLVRACRRHPRCPPLERPGRPLASSQQAEQSIVPLCHRNVRLPIAHHCFQEASASLAENVLQQRSPLSSMRRVAFPLPVRSTPPKPLCNLLPVGHLELGHMPPPQR